MIIADNGYAELEEFMKLNGIRHIRTAPYHPASNGEAVRAVKIFKERLKRIPKAPIRCYWKDSYLAIA